MRGQDAARFPGMRASDAAAKPPQLHGGGGGGGGSSELPGSSPQPPPLSPHPCEGGGEEAGEAMKNPSTPHSQHFYQNPPEACLGGPKGGEDPHRLEGLGQHFHPAYPPEPLEPSVYVGAAVHLEEDGGHAPWRFFNLPRRKEAELSTPLLPGDRLRDEASGGADVVSVTE